MALKFIFYKNGEIELVNKVILDDGRELITEYIAYWDNRTKFNESLGDGK